MPQSVSGDLGLPEELIGLGYVAAAGAAMPEASIDKNGEICLGKEEVGFAWYPFGVHDPPAHFGANKPHFQQEFSAFVAPPANCRHNLRTCRRNIAELAAGES
jgi:hypothetical protein